MKNVIEKQSSDWKNKVLSFLKYFIPVVLLVVPSLYYLVICDTFFGKYDFVYQGITYEEISIYSNNEATHYFYNENGTIEAKSKCTWFRSQETSDDVERSWFILVPKENGFSQQNMIVQDGTIVDQTICYKYSNEGLYRLYQR